MRNRYVKRCNCESPPVVTKSTTISLKGVLDIELNVSCPGCKKPYKEVVSKKTRMINPQISVEITKHLPGSEEIGEELILDHQPEFTDAEESGTGVEDGLAGKGIDDIETGESEEVSGKKEEPTGTPTEVENPKNASGDKGRDSDEARSPNPFEEHAKKRRGRPPGKKEGTEPVDVVERPFEKALEDSGIPLGDILA